MEITEIHRSLLIEELEQYTIVDLEPVPEPFLSLRKSRAPIVVLRMVKFAEKLPKNWL